MRMPQALASPARGGRKNAVAFPPRYLTNPQYRLDCVHVEPTPGSKPRQVSALGRKVQPISWAYSRIRA